MLNNHATRVRIVIAVLTVGLLAASTVLTRNWEAVGSASLEISNPNQKPSSKGENQGVKTGKHGQEKEMTEKIVKSDAEWKKELTPDQYQVLRQAGTERAFTGAYWDKHEKGVYNCAACGLKLFSSETKFDSGTGWPSFYAPVSKSNVEEEIDNTLGMVRTEVKCRRCGSHLGHVFDDGPEPTGLRYCMNSLALKFVKE